MANWQTNEFSGRRHLYDMDEYNRRIASGELRPVATGIEQIDRHLDIEPENLVVVAARPKQGKTSTMLSMFCSQAQTKVARPGFFSLEMSNIEITRRAISNISGVPYGVIRHGNSGGSHAVQHKVNAARKMFDEYPIQVCGDPGLSVDDIGDRAAQMITQAGTDIIYIDQLSHIRHMAKGGLYEKFTDTTKRCKLLARELGVPVVLAAQLNRASEADGKGRMPRLENLKQSGSIEEDADIILMPWRPNSQGDCPEIKWQGESLDVTNKVVMLCLAYRNGGIWSEVMDFDGPCMKLGQVRV